MSVRVLQIIADTDPGPSNDSALSLHVELIDQGLEVRTLALTPGNQPGHEQLVPTIAHSRRSVAARTGVGGERRWADVVVLHGAGALVGATRPPRSSPVPTVYAAHEPNDLDVLIAGARPASGFSGRLAHIVVGPEAGGALASLAEPDRLVVVRLADADTRGAVWAEVLRDTVGVVG